MKMTIRELEMMHDSCCTEEEMRKETPSELSGTHKEYARLRKKIAATLEIVKKENGVLVSVDSD